VAFKDVLPTFKAQEDWEGGANDWRGAGGPELRERELLPSLTFVDRSSG
jgi:hypothetical protein